MYPDIHESSPKTLQGSLRETETTKLNNQEDAQVIPPDTVITTPIRNSTPNQNETKATLIPRRSSRTIKKPDRLDL